MRVTVLAVSAALAASALVSTATAAEAKPKYSITLQANQDSADFENSTVHIEGTVTPTPAPGSTVTIYRSANGKKAKKIGETPVDGDGAYGYDLKGSKKSGSNNAFVESGPTVIKVVTPKTSKRAAGSRSTDIDVFGYVPLSKLERKTLVGKTSVSTFEAPDQDYAKAIRMRGAGKSPEVELRVDLKKQCWAVFGYGGVDKRSPEGSYGMQKTYLASSKGDVVREIDGFARTGADDAQQFSLNFYDLQDTARYLRFDVEVFSDGADKPAYWGLGKTYAYCNLPGGEFGD